MKKAKSEIFLWSQRNFSEIEGHSEKGGNASLPQREWKPLPTSSLEIIQISSLGPTKKFYFSWN